MKKCRLVLVCMLMTVMMVGIISSGAQAVTPVVDPFPIGIFWPPSPENTNFSTYQDIKNMNATYVTMGNGNDTFAECDAALTQCAANGLKAVVADARLNWNYSYLNQTTTGSGRYVSNSSSLGQTITAPAGTGWGLNTVQLYIDKNYWPSGTTLTLSIYTNPGKTTLVSSDSITGPVDTYYPIFEIYKSINANTSYYMELTSNTSSNVGWVVCSSSDVYAGGQAYENGSARSGYDFWFKVEFAQRMYNDASQPAVSDIDAVAAHYQGNSALLGYELLDEPSAMQLTRIQAAMERFRQDDPNHITYVNLFPTYASSDQLGFGAANGDWVTPSRSFGQTFRTNASTSYISTIQMYIDMGQWSASEPLTLKLWNSPAKTILMAQSTLYGSTTYYPKFTLNVNTTPNTVYYFELTHGGGGDNSVGWVVKSSDGIDWEKDGTGYVNGSPINADFWFTLNQDITAFSYEDYVYRWVSKGPDILMYDHYPFRSDGSLSTDYYTNMEIIRRQALKASVPFWTYIQSTGISGFMRSPSAAEVRYHVYTSLAYGAKGINYFLYSTPSGDGFFGGIILADGTKNTTLYNAVRDTNAEVLKLGPVLKNLTSQQVYHTGTLPASTTQLPSDFFWKPSDTSLPLVIGYFHDSSGRKYILAVNRDYTNSRTVSFTVSPKPADINEISKIAGSETDTNYNPSTGILSSTFAPGEGRLYVMPAGY